LDGEEKKKEGKKGRREDGMEWNGMDERSLT
jgi:hypothetical protein